MPLREKTVAAKSLCYTTARVYVKRLYGCPLSIYILHYKLYRDIYSPSTMSIDTHIYILWKGYCYNIETSHDFEVV